MGRRIIARRRGKGTQVFRSQRHRKLGEVKHYPLKDFGEDGHIEGQIMEFVHEISRNVPLAVVEFETGEQMLWLPPEGVFVGDTIQVGTKGDIAVGNTMTLENIPEGTLVYNIEIRPGDGGKLVRASGTTATVMTRVEKGVIVEMPSGKRVIMNPNSRATIGVVPGGGKISKPWVKAGSKSYWARVRTVFWPRVKGRNMNANSHPYGGGRKRRAGMPTTTSRNAPPGRKVGKIAAQRTGRRKK